MTDPTSRSRQIQKNGPFSRLWAKTAIREHLADLEEVLSESRALATAAATTFSLLETVAVHSAVHSPSSFIEDLYFDFECFSQTTHEDDDLSNVAKYFVRAVGRLFSHAALSLKLPSLGRLQATSELILWQSVWLHLRRDPDLHPHELAEVAFELYCAIGEHDAVLAMRRAQVLTAKVLNCLMDNLNDVTDIIEASSTATQFDGPTDAMNLWPDLDPLLEPEITGTFTIVYTENVKLPSTKERHGIRRLEQRRTALSANPTNNELELVRIDKRLAQLRQMVNSNDEYNLRIEGPERVIKTSMITL